MSDAHPLELQLCGKLIITVWYNVGGYQDELHCVVAATDWRL